jgi:hypothetical protein
MEASTREKGEKPRAIVSQGARIVILFQDDPDPYAWSSGK